MEAVLIAFVTALVGAILVFFKGKKSQRLEDAERELDRLVAADKAASRVDLLSDDDVVRELKKRGLYRGDEPTGDR